MTSDATPHPGQAAPEDFWSVPTERLDEIIDELIISRITARKTVGIWTQKAASHSVRGYELKKQNKTKVADECFAQAIVANRQARAHQVAFRKYSAVLLDARNVRDHRSMERGNG
jgi:hypothetical protein